MRLLCLIALLLVTAGCARDAASEDPRAQSSQTPDQATPARPSRVDMHHAPRCTAGDLVVRFRPEGDGAGGHAIALLDFRNVSGSRCLLSGYPRRVTLHEPGHRAVTATRGSFFPVDPSEPIEPGEVTTLGVETDTYCPARPSGGPGGPIYHEVRISLRSGVLGVTAPHDGLDVGCGARLTTFTRWR